MNKKSTNRKVSFANVEVGEVCASMHRLNESMVVIFKNGKKAALKSPRLSVAVGGTVFNCINLATKKDDQTIGVSNRDIVNVHGVSLKGKISHFIERTTMV